MNLAVRATLEPLEPRVLMSGNFLYVNDNWVTQGATVANSGSGDDSSLQGLTPGTNAFNTLNDALTAASAGDTIVVVSGTYSESATITKGVTLEGWVDFANTYASPAANPDPTHLTQSALNATLVAHVNNVQWAINDSAAENVAVKGFAFAGLAATGAIEVASANNAGVAISNNTFTDNTTVSTAIRMDMANSASPVAISGNTFTGAANAMLVQGSAQASITLNAISVSSTGIDIEANASATISNNTISGSTTGILFNSTGAGTITGTWFNQGISNVTDLVIGAGKLLLIGPGNHFAGSSLYINNESPTNFALTGEDFGTHDNAVLAAKILDHLDDPARGLVAFNMPVLDTFGVSSASIFENDSLILSGTYHDTLATGMHTLTINWGDGSSPQTVSVSGGTFAIPHQNLDLNPSGTPSVLNQINASLVVDDGGTAGGTASVTVNNVAPTLAANLDQTTILENGTVTLSGIITDPGTLDTFVLRIDWGPGQGGVLNVFLTNFFDIPGFGFWDPVTRQFAISHQYPDDTPSGTSSDNFTVSANVTDDDTGLSNTVTQNLTVDNVAPSNVGIAIGSAAPPVITSGTNSATVYSGTALTLNGSFTDPGTLDAHTFLWHVSASNGQVIPDGTNQNFSFVPNLNGTANATYSVALTVSDDDLGSGSSAPFVLTVTPVNTNTIAGRFVFYKGSVFDTGSHDNAIATDKSALLPGGTATLANYTSFDRGINGLMVDIAGPVSGLTAGDFAFKVGNDNAPDGWTLLGATPSITVRPGAGVGGANRVEITFADGTIVKEWLQVKVLANVHTALSADDVFYFGNAVGEAGDNPANARVTAVDETAARAAQTSIAPITDLYDYNRDGVVDVADQVFARSNVTFFLNELKLIAVPGGAQASLLLPTNPTGPLVPVLQPLTGAPVPAPPVTDTFVAAVPIASATTTVIPTFSAPASTTAPAVTPPDTRPASKPTRPVSGQARKLPRVIINGLRKLGLEWLRRY